MASSSLSNEKMGKEPLPVAENPSKKAPSVPPSEESNTDGTPDKQAGIGDFFRIFRYADRLDRVLYGAAFTGAIIVGASLPLMTLIFGSSTSTLNDYAVGQDNARQFQNNIDGLILYFVYLFVGRFVISYLATLCICIAAARTTNSLRKAFLDSLLRQDISHFDMQGNGSAATQVTTNGHRVNQGIAEKLYTAVTGLSLFFSAYIVALAVQWKLALITMSIVPAIVLVTGGCISLDAPIEGRITRLYSRAATIAQDALSSIKTIHAFGAQPKIVSWYDEYLRTAHQEGKKKSILFGVLFSCQTFLVLSGTALAFWEGHRLFQSGEIPNVGTVFTVVLSVTLGATSTLFILPQVDPVTKAASAAYELFTIIDKPSLLDPLSEEGHQPQSCQGEIEFRDVQFEYPTRSTAPVLQGVNLHLPPGKTTAIVGASGCGKSTLVALLERWYRPSSGQILLDGSDIAEYNTKWLRTNIKLVQQEPTLFAGTVFENVAKGLTDKQLTLSDEKQMQLIKEACQSADAHGFISQLPQGYHTPLGESARMLSGGQRQRLCIARSIVSDPRILLFDEATSALDPRAEKVVQEALNRVSMNKTTLIIAHKLATVMAADSIAVMASGRVVEQGTHQELLREDRIYAAMVRAQDLGHDSKEYDVRRNEDLDSEKPSEKTIALQRTRSTTAPTDAQHEVEQLTAETLGYSLIRCIFIVLKEHRDLYAWYLLIFAGCLIAGGTFPAQAYLFSRLTYVFTLQGAEAQSKADFYALMFFVVALANLLAYFNIGIATNTIGQTLTYRYRREMLERVLSFDQDFYDCPENSSGAITARLTSVPSALQELLSANLGLIVNVLVNVTASSIFGIAFGWKLGLVLVFAGITLIVGGGYVRVRLDQRLESSTEKQFARSASLAAEAVGAIRTVNLLTLESSVLQRYGEILDGIVGKVIRSLIPTLLPYAFSQSVDFLVLALGFWYGARLIASGQYSVTQFFVVFISIVFGGQGAAQLFTWTTSITKARGSANYLLWLRTVKPSICENDENQDNGPPDEDSTIELERVEFRYKQRAEARVLRDISMKIQPGMYAAFVGPSGCGKSTIVSLLERFYDPTSGRVLLGGGDVSLMSPVRYRRYMSLVQQEPPLYLGSVRDNIAIGLSYEPSEDEVHEACRQANALEFVSSLPEGLETQCGVRGLQFSGGQRQRIAVARALIRKSRLLLLDEATSALDTQSERLVQEALDKAASTRTTIAVAHRLSTIRHADVIFVIDEGRIAEMGTHEQLQELRGQYYAMCLSQSLDQA